MYECLNEETAQIMSDVLMVWVKRHGFQNQMTTYLMKAKTRIPDVERLEILLV
jgi:hypothetical protein